MEWAIYVVISCSEPRLPFVQFFEKINHVKYPGHPMEDRSSSMRRAMDAVASYIDYAEAYRDRCGR